MMLFNFDGSEAEKKLPDSLKEYFFKRCDITQKEYEVLIKMAQDLPIDLLKKRLKVMADYFYRLKSENEDSRINNEFAYAKKIILSDSFFENQKIDHTIPNVKETKKYLDEIQKKRVENPGVDKNTFHKKVEKIKNLYDINLGKDSKEVMNKKNQNEINEKTASILKKLEDENQIKKLESEITSVFKDLLSCELEYRLLKTSLMNIYLYHNEKMFYIVLNKIKDKKMISIKKLSEIRKSVLKQFEKENEND
ncbi:MAG: hypothetical protein U9N62_11915 [Thermotogota bacterium]|nr:hypothetical protein [Thermotogota bacterium]